MVPAKEINFMIPGHSDTNRGKRMKKIYNKNNSIQESNYFLLSLLFNISR